MRFRNQVRAIKSKPSIESRVLSSNGISPPGVSLKYLSIDKFFGQLTWVDDPKNVLALKGFLA